MKTKLKKTLFLLASTIVATYSYNFMINCSSNIYQIKYGDIVNCLDNQSTDGKTTYQTLETIQSAIKRKANKSIEKQIKEDSLPKWSNNDDKSEIYFDIIASLAFNFKVNDSINYDFFFISLNLETNEISIKIDNGINIAANNIQYNFDNNEINMYLFNDQQVIIKSYTFESINSIIQ